MAKFEPGHAKVGGRGKGTTNYVVAMRRERLAEAERIANETIGDFHGTAHEFLTFLFQSGKVPLSIRTDAGKTIHATEVAKLKAVAHFDASQMPTPVLRDIRAELLKIEQQRDVLEPTDAEYTTVVDDAE